MFKHLILISHYIYETTFYFFADTNRHARHYTRKNPLTPRVKYLPPVP
jgi:hypothetical protein